MEATVNVTCYKSKVLKNGESPLMVRICKNGKKKYKSLGISVNPAHWDFKKNLPKPKCPNYATLLILINEKISEIQRIILNKKVNNVEFTANPTPIHRHLPIQAPRICWRRISKLYSSS